MARNKQKLELTWIGKDDRKRLEPRILLEDKEKSYHATHRVTEDDIFDNILIKGDNLLALKALEQEYTGKVKCIYIDPPYNTGSAFMHYDDGIEHSLWLSLIRDRLEILRRLLSEDGSIWITLDDNEAHYCKVLCDEIFGRPNFVSSIVWQKVFAKKNKALISSSHDFILIYAKNIESWKRNLLPRNKKQKKAFKNPDNDPRGDWQSVSYSVQSEDSEKRKAYRYPIDLPSGESANPPAGRHWNGLPERTEKLILENRLWFGPKGDRSPRLKVFMNEVQQGIVPDSWWNHEDNGNNQEAKKEMLLLFPDIEPFTTAKPEKLLKKVIEIATNEDDLVLDSFAGSGTTGAVAHKMRRRWIMVELGEHCNTHIVPRLQRVIDGEDSGGITEAVGWKGGGGFRFYELAPSLLKKDKRGNYIINPEYNAEMLTEAMCKQLGFTYEPSDSVYWKQGYSTENDFIYVTTQQLSREILQAISDEVGDDRTLLVCCKSFRAGKTEFPNLTIQKIPNSVLNRCEWDRDDYSLEIKELPLRDDEDDQEPGFIVPKDSRQASLFDSDEEE